MNVVGIEGVEDPIEGVPMDYDQDNEGSYEFVMEEVVLDDPDLLFGNDEGRYSQHQQMPE